MQDRSKSETASFRFTGATAVAAVMLAVSLAMLWLINRLQARIGREAAA